MIGLADRHYGTGACKHAPTTARHRNGRTNGVSNGRKNSRDNKKAAVRHSVRAAKPGRCFRCDVKMVQQSSGLVNSLAGVGNRIRAVHRGGYF